MIFYKFPTHCCAVCLLSALAASCSTTSGLPEGELLYTGQKSITYSDSPQPSRKSRKAAKTSADSTGVITAVADAVKAVDKLFSGEGSEVGTSASERGQREAPESLGISQPRQTTDAAAMRHWQATREEVEAVLAYAPNNAIFGSSSLHWPVQPGLWLYNALVGREHGLGHWIYKVFATRPVLVSQVSPELRARVAQNTLQGYGYFRARVGSEVLPEPGNARRAKVAYNVAVGPLSRLDSIAYKGFPAGIDSILHSPGAEKSSLLKRGDPFSAAVLQAEQQRIDALLREQGYFYHQASHTTFRADTLERAARVWLQVVPAPSMPARAARPWVIGDTYVALRRSATDSLTHVIRRAGSSRLRAQGQPHTRSRRAGKFSSGAAGRRLQGVRTFSFSGEKIPLRPGLITRAISHRSGNLYRLSDQQATLSQLSALGVFAGLDVSYMPRDTSQTCDTLDLYVQTVMDKPYDVSLEMNATYKSNQQLGPGANFSLSKRNAFGAAEKVSLSVFGSYEWQTGSGRAGGNGLLNSYELGTQLSLWFPRLLAPGARRLRRGTTSSTEFAVGVDWKNRSGFFNLLSYTLGATYKWSRHGGTVQHELTPLGLEYNKIFHTSPTFDSIMDVSPALYVSMRDQLVPYAGYTFTYTSSGVHRNPVWVQLSLKEAGGLTSCFYRLGGKRFDASGKRLLGVPFAQFLKLTAEARENIKLSDGLRLATRLYVGMVQGYGNASRAPYADQFFVGGAGSIRGFTVRTLGPGAYRPKQARYSYLDQTGDVRLEANAELRMRLLGSLHGAAFLDAGNVWLLRSDPTRPDAKLTLRTLRNIALGTGLGLRYDLDFLVLRFDVGVPLHAPYSTGRCGFFNVEKTGRNLAYHFAIGYPF